MSITFKTSDSLSRLGLLPFSLFEVLLLISGTCEFPFITKFPIVLELQKFAKIICKVSNICNLVSLTFFVPSYVVSNICCASLAMVMCEIWWNSSGDTPQKIALGALLLAFDAARAALSQVDLAVFGLVQPISTASQIA